jgi:hypothetical protein
MLAGKIGYFRASLDPAAAAYIAAVEAADGQALEAAVRTAINNFVVGCKADGIWSAIKASCVLMGARTLAGALVPLVGAAPTNVNFAAGDYNRKAGLIGNGSTKYLNSNRRNNADPQNNFHIAIYASAIHGGSGAPGSYAGAGATASGATTLLRNFVSGADAAYIARCRSSANSGAVGSTTPATGLFGASRSASASYVIRTGSSNSSISTASESPTSGNLFVFAREDNAGSQQQHSNGRLAFYSIGESLALASLDSRITALYNAIGAAIP